MHPPSYSTLTLTPTRTLTRYTPASLRPYKTEVQKIRREAHSYIVTSCRDSYLLLDPDVIHRVKPNAKKAAELALRAKAEHMPMFDKLIGPVGPGFVLDGNERFMWKFHASKGTTVPYRNRVVACGNPTVRPAGLPASLLALTLAAALAAPLPSPHRCPRRHWPCDALTHVILLLMQFQRVVADVVQMFPPGQYRDITLMTIAAFIAFLKAHFTNKFIGDQGVPRSVDTLTYGDWDTRRYSSAFINEIANWLLDEDAVPTEWDVLLKIRDQHRDE